MEYKPEDLKMVQKIEVEILQEIIRVCEENSILYWVAYGTLIGALRHNGFIPWDDDIDIGMMRTDYEKFIKIAPKALKKGYTLQHYTTDPKTPTYHAKVRKDGTQFVEWYTRSMNIHHGIFVDIMPHDLIPEDRAKRKKYRKVGEWKKQLYFAKTTTETTMARGSDVWKKTMIRRILHILVIPIPKKVLFKILDNSLRQYNNSDSHMCTSRAREVNEFSIDDLFPLKKHIFESIEVNIPANCDAILWGEYGDYMKLPPPEKRISHSPYILKFEEELP